MPQSQPAQNQNAAANQPQTVQLVVRLPDSWVAGKSAPRIVLSLFCRVLSVFLPWRPVMRIVRLLGGIGTSRAVRQTLSRMDLSGMGRAWDQVRSAQLLRRCAAAARDANWLKSSAGFVRSRRWLVATLAVCVSILLLIVLIQPHRMGDNLLADSLEFGGPLDEFTQSRPATAEQSPSPGAAVATASSAGRSVFFDPQKQLPSATPPVAAPALLHAETENPRSIRPANFEGHGRGAQLIGTIEAVNEAPPARTVSGVVIRAANQ